MAHLHALRDDIGFDFEATLRLARQLWALADQVGSLMASRQAHAAAASVAFSGRYADDFGRRLGREAEEAGRLVAHLRSDAGLSATAWSRAMHDENQIRYARHVDHLRRQRNVLEAVWEHSFGETFPPEPDPVPVPVPPLFAPTAELVVYR